MKILHVSPMYAPALGGAEHHLQAISEGLVCRGHAVTVFTANVVNGLDAWLSRHGGLPEVEFINGVKVVRFDPEGGLLAKAFDKWLRLKGGWRSVNYIFTPGGLELLSQGPRTLTMIPQILRCNADIIASMNWYWPPAYHTYLAGRLKRFTLVGIPLFHTAQPWCNRSIYRRMLPSHDAVIVNTNYEGQFAQERGATRVEVTGVGIDPHTFDRRRGEDVRAYYGLGSFPVVGFVGRQEATKGVVKLIEAMRTVWEWNKEVRLVLAGPRSDEKVEAKLVNLPSNQKARIVQIGLFEEKDKGSIFDAFDVFAMPSREESFGITYLEAWLCNKPVIGARIGPTQCVIDEGRDGLLADPEDPEDIARAIIALLSNSNMREKLGRSGHDKAIAQYTWDKVVDKVEGLYLGLAATKAARGFAKLLPSNQIATPGS